MLIVQEDTWEELIKLKLELRQSSIDQTISYLLYELNKEDEN